MIEIVSMTIGNLSSEIDVKVNGEYSSLKIPVTHFPGATPPPVYSTVHAVSKALTNHISQKLEEQRAKATVIEGIVCDCPCVENIHTDVCPVATISFALTCCKDGGHHIGKALEQHSGRRVRVTIEELPEEDGEE